MTDSLTIDATSRVDVSGRGYLGAWRSGNSSSYGRTLGNTTVDGSYLYSGGSYGALGGQYSTYWVNVAYGDPTDPQEVGSGGGGINIGYPGGSGGGLVRITAGTVAVDGVILADGMSVNSGGGAGSGGGIRIAAETVAGNGLIVARGGTVTSGAGAAGGGGRIAIYYNTMTLPMANIDQGGGVYGDGSNATLNGQEGLLHLQTGLPL